MTDPAQIAIRASTQEHLEIEDIKDDIVILKNGGACLIIGVTSINYDLLSEKEQEAIIYAYASLLNSLTFPIQIVIRSQKKDISSYLNLLKEVEEKEKRPLIKKQIKNYANFVIETVKKNNVLDKKFYIVIPMFPLEIGATKLLTSGLIAKKRTLPFDKNYILEKAKINLYPKRDHIFRLLGRLGIKGRQLNTQELIKLFFDIYNPESPGQKTTETKEYQEPIVRSTLPPINLTNEKKEPSAPPPTKEEEKPSSEIFFQKVDKIVNEVSKSEKNENTFSQ
jgi:hypothetical protein